MTNEINSYYFDHKPTKKEERLIDLSTDDGVAFSSSTVTDAINAARWETEGGAHKSCAGSLMGYKFFTEAVSAELSAYDGFVAPDNIRVNRGDITSFPSLWGSFPKNTRIYIPVPTSRETLCGAEGYFEEPCFFSSDCVFDKPVPSDISAAKCSEALPEVIYLSLSNNPTGLTFTYSELAAWIDYAKKISAVIIFDTTLGLFCEVSEWRQEYPRTVYEIPGAFECAVEVCSFAPSYRAGIPCGYCIIPEGVCFRGRSLLSVYDKKLKAAGKKTPESSCFERHVSYVIQRGAAAHLSPAGKLESMKTAKEYQRNARKLCAALALKGFECTFGGVSPYIFGRFCDDGFDFPFPPKSVSACEHLENKLAIRVLRGAAFGLNDKKSNGWQEYMRISGTVVRDKAEEAQLRILGL